MKHWLLDHSVIQRLLFYTNSYRRQNNLHPLKLELKMSLAAQTWAQKMVYVGYIHSPYPWSECIHTGPSSARICIREWMNSPSHRDILLSNRPPNAPIGFGYWKNRTGWTYWVAEI